MNTEVFVTCPYCGAQRIESIDVQMASDTAYLTSLAVNGCNCEQAALKRGMDRTRASIDQLLGDGSKQRGYDYELCDDTLAAITEVCESMLKQCFDKVTLEEPNGDQIKLIVDGNRVKITRTQKRQMSL